MLQYIWLAEFKYQVRESIHPPIVVERFKRRRKNTFNIQINGCACATRHNIVKDGHQNTIKLYGQLIKQVTRTSELHIRKRMLSQTFHTDVVFVHSNRHRIAVFNDDYGLARNE